MRVSNTASSLLPTKTGTSTSPTRAGTCNIANPMPPNTLLNVAVTGRGGQPIEAGGSLQITVTMSVCGQKRVRTFPVTFEDEVTFQLPDDLYWSTEAFLNGTALFFMYLAKWGWDREP